jgi:SpoVK/Ycf46/Vps4 family AAA+-type ATPase
MSEGYLKTATAPRVADRTEALNKVLSEIDEMIGLGSVKHQLNQLIAFARVVALRRDRDIAAPAINLHMVFSGPPGTGKTVIARKVGRMLNAIGLLKTDKFVEADRAQLVGQHVGQTAPRVKDKVEEAMDGVLFIDEAYTLVNGGKPDGQSDPFGQEAVDTLLKLMEDYRERLVVIVAGYTNEMRRFVDSNVGLKSRFSRFIDFESYSEQELFEIFLSMARQASYRLTPEAETLAAKQIKWMRKSADERFGNARAVRGLFESILPVQAERIASLPNLAALDDQTLLTITDHDVQAVIE